MYWIFEMELHSLGKVPMMLLPLRSLQKVGQNVKTEVEQSDSWYIDQAAMSVSKRLDPQLIPLWKKIRLCRHDLLSMTHRSSINDRHWSTWRWFERRPQGITLKNKAQSTSLAEVNNLERIFHGKGFSYWKRPPATYMERIFDIELHTRGSVPVISLPLRSLCSRKQTPREAVSFEAFNLRPNNLS